MMTSEIPLRTDDFGKILGLAVHDSNLTGFTYAGESLELVLRGVKGDVSKIRCTSIHDANFAHLYHGAIVADIYVWRLAEVPQAWDVPDGAWYVLYKERLGIEGAQTQALALATTLPDHFLIQVECSYGGSIAAVCKGIELVRGAGSPHRS